MSSQTIRKRKEIIQKVIDRLIEYGDKYLVELEQLNNKYPPKSRNRNLS